MELNGGTISEYNDGGLKLEKSVILHDSKEYATHISLDISPIGLLVEYRNPAVATNPNASGSFDIYQYSNHTVNGTTGLCGMLSQLGT